MNLLIYVAPVVAVRLAIELASIRHVVGQGTVANQAVEGIVRQLKTEGKFEVLKCFSLTFIEALTIYRSIVSLALLSVNHFV